MRAFFYKDLQNKFVDIRFLHSHGNYDKDRCERTIAEIRTLRKKIKAYSNGQEKEILLYCIDTLFEILNEGDNQKTFDFADAIHNIPEIYMQKRNLYSFRKELSAFQKNYGKQYFAFINEVKPHFTKKAQKNKWEYFSAASDEDFKKMHPVGYKLLVLCGITALMLPQFIYLIYIEVTKAPNEWPLMVGYVGTFIVGIGLFNIVAAWIHQYLGHLLTVSCFIIGAALIALSFHLLYA